MAVEMKTKKLELVQLIKWGIVWIRNIVGFSEVDKDREINAIGFGLIERMDKRRLSEQIWEKIMKGQVDKGLSRVI